MFTLCSVYDTMYLKTKQDNLSIKKRQKPVLFLSGKCQLNPCKIIFHEFPRNLSGRTELVIRSVHFASSVHMWYANFHETVTNAQNRLYVLSLFQLQIYALHFPSYLGVVHLACKFRKQANKRLRFGRKSKLTHGLGCGTALHFRFVQFLDTSRDRVSSN